MAKSGFPWSIKGIDRKTREIVRQQASAAGLTIGAWVDAVILDSSQRSRTSKQSRFDDRTTQPSLASKTKSLEDVYDTALLESVNAELDASRSRLNQALRPIFFSLQDLALRQSVISQSRLSDAESSRKYHEVVEKVSLSDSNIQTGDHLGASKDEQRDFKRRPTAKPPTDDLGGLEYPFMERQFDESNSNYLSQVSQGEASSNISSKKEITTASGFSISKFVLMIILLVGITGASFVFLYEGSPSVLATKDKIQVRIVKNSESVLETLHDSYSALKRNLNDLLLMVAQWLGQPDTPKPGPQSSISSERVKTVAGLIRETPSTLVEPSKDSPLFPGDKRENYRSVNEIGRGNFPQLPQSRSDNVYSGASTTNHAKGSKALIHILPEEVKPRKTSLNHNSLTRATQLKRENHSKIDIKLIHPIPDVSKNTSKKNAYLAFLENEARAGDPKAQNELALTILQSNGQKAHHETALNWLKASAIQGLAAAQYNLAVLYDRGIGEVKDEIRAFFWYQRAAKQAHPMAQYNLGHFFMTGRVVPLDFKQSAHWFEAASSQSITEASFNLGVFAERGLGAKADLKKAIKLYKKAANSGSIPASKRLKTLTQPKIEIRVTPELASLLDLQSLREKDVKSTIAGIQQVLLQGGFYSGRIDGIAGPKTKAAIWTYQLDYDLPLTGLPSKLLLDFMENSLNFPNAD